jgi:hypothetical protein
MYPPIQILYSNKIIKKIKRQEGTWCIQRTKIIIILNPLKCIFIFQQWEEIGFGRGDTEVELYNPGFEFCLLLSIFCMYLARKFNLRLHYNSKISWKLA